MYTAQHARDQAQKDLDRRIEAAVKENDGGPNAAYLRVYIEDPWVINIKAELERRSFKNVDVPDITLKGDVYFEWSSNSEDD